MKTQKTSAFTLLELLIVLLGIGIVAAAIIASVDRLK